MATTFSPYIQNELDQTNNFGFGEFNYKPISDFYTVMDSGGAQEILKSLPTRKEDVFAGTGPYEKQGLYSDVKHTLGASTGKDAIIDWASQFGIDTSGKFADVIGNTGILAATALQEIPDAWRIGKQAFKKGDYEALLSGAFLSQPWEDVLANFDALSIPYGLDTNEKLDYIPNLQKWKMMLDQRATNQGIAQVAMQKQIQEAEAAQAQAAANAAAAGQRRAGRGGSHMSRSVSQGGLGISAAQAQSVSDANAAAGMSGWGLARGGLIDLYRYGGFI